MFEKSVLAAGPSLIVITVLVRSQHRSTKLVAGYNSSPSPADDEATSTAGGQRSALGPVTRQAMSVPINGRPSLPVLMTVAAIEQASG